MATHTFLYDDACPMCKGYTSIFETMRWSKRRGFSTVTPADVPLLDVDRGRHEIPLINTDTGEVSYGLDAMTTVLAEGLPLLRPLLKHPLLTLVLKPLYWLITYNRRVIAGTKPPATGFDCAPDFHAGWRIAYLALAALLVLLIGTPPALMLLGMGLALCCGLLTHRSKLDLLGHFATVMIMVSTALAILPGGLGLVAGYGVAAWEGWRRLG